MYDMNCCHMYMCVQIGVIFTSVQAFAAEVQFHQEPIEALRSEGDGLKGQGSPDDGKKVDHWVNDLAQRWDELGGATDERQVCTAQPLCNQIRQPLGLTCVFTSYAV